MRNNENAEVTAEPLLQLDVEAIIKNRIKGKGGKLIPSALFRGLASLICQDELNRVLREAYPLEGEDFAAKALEILGVSVEAVGLDKLPEHKYVFAANHPLGGLDGLALITVIARRFGEDSVRFPVNDMLMNVSPLKRVFTPLNKYGAQDREGLGALNDAFASDRQIAMFPAGLVSRRQEDGSIADLKWKKTFVSKALEYDRWIVPVYIEALNRKRFYRLAKWRKKLGIKVNLEQALLPSEVCHSRGLNIRIFFGEPVSPEQLKDTGLSHALMAAKIRLLSDALRPDNK